jgi:galactokinase
VTRAAAFAPGRVNLLGEHTDYNGGLSLAFAIREGITVTVEPGKRGSDDPLVQGIVTELGVRDVNVAIESDLPQGAGLSSSAAVAVAAGLALLRLSGRDMERLELAKLCSRVENEWLGAQTGLLDQIASLFGEAGHVIRIDFRSLEVRQVPLDLGGWRLALVDSGERHSNAAGGYKDRRGECAEAAARLGVQTLSEAGRADAERLPDPLDRRALHVLDENERVDAAIDALVAGDLPALGRLLDAGHASVRDLYDSSTDAVERTVTRLKDAGAAGARMMGGGFGGHVLALFDPDTPPPDGARVVAPGPGARVID